jgi:hypothetical protein
MLCAYRVSVTDGDIVSVQDGYVVTRSLPPRSRGNESSAIARSPSVSASLYMNLPRMFKVRRHIEAVALFNLIPVLIRYLSTAYPQRNLEQDPIMPPNLVMYAIRLE